MQLWERFRAGQKPPESLGASRDFNVDMVPKFIMANGNLVKVPLRLLSLLLHPLHDVSTSRSMSTSTILLMHLRGSCKSMEYGSLTAELFASRCW